MTYATPTLQATACVECGTIFTPYRSKQRFCGAKCNNRSVNREYQRTKRLEMRIRFDPEATFTIIETHPHDIDMVGMDYQGNELNAILEDAAFPPYAVLRGSDRLWDVVTGEKYQHLVAQDNGEVIMCKEDRRRA